MNGYKWTSGQAGKFKRERRRLLTCVFVLLYAATAMAEAAGADDERPFEKKYKLRGAGKRDPFTIWEQQMVKPPPFNPNPLNVEESLIRKPTTPEPGARTTPDDLAPIIGQVTGLLEAAYNHLLGRHYEAAVKVCDEALKMLEGTGAPAGSLEERALRIRKAAERLKLRRDVEKEFDKLPITIQGIVWEPENAFAVINDRMVSEGRLLEGTAARVYKILPRKVVFVFQGIKVSKRLFEGGTTDAPKKQPGPPRR